ncbi:MAG: hypothetical protein J2P57_17455 [Acidimicrobiaceae bacterium]|nr:hypothetical protein [Acidimicrobiaceae bacterium]
MAKAMDERERQRRNSRCSFCGKTYPQVRKLVAGPGVYICDQCVELCNDVLREDAASGGCAGAPPPSRPAPGRRAPWRLLLPWRNWRLAGSQV